MTNPSSKLREILDQIELSDDGGCGDPECCGASSDYISQESLDKAEAAIRALILEGMPKERDRDYGWNTCRQAMREYVEGL